jgi:AraC family transcriptional regulator of adaptative response/methylated-DNA-[protein]-cysteine methyltransferase
MTKLSTLSYAFTLSSLGQLLLAKTQLGVCYISLGPEQNNLLTDLQRRFPSSHLQENLLLCQAELQKLHAHIENPVNALHMDLDIHGTTFQRQVWTVLQRIPVGETYNYAQVAAQIGAVKAVRAVANACGSNRLAIAIPCHRVIRSDGQLSGFRWGVAIKAELLRREALALNSKTLDN